MEIGLWSENTAKSKLNNPKTIESTVVARTIERAIPSAPLIPAQQAEEADAGNAPQ